MSDEEPEAAPTERAAYQAPGPAPPRTPRRILGFGGLALLLIGVAKLEFDASSLAISKAAWMPILAGTFALIAVAVWLVLDTPTPDGLVEQPPKAANRRLTIAAVVIGLVLVQALIPLRYYLGDDAFDERFSWRMFSAVRVYQCQLAAFDQRHDVESPVPLPQQIHVGWVTTMRRNREAVLDRYLRWRCEEHGVDGARLLNQCRSPEGRRADVTRTIDCASGLVTGEDAR